MDPTLPYADASFDAVTCVVSVDYLNKPLDVFKEVCRVLKPGGKFILSQSNRCFPSKAIAMWLGQSDMQHCQVIGAYFHYAFAAAFGPRARLRCSCQRTEEVTGNADERPAIHCRGHEVVKLGVRSLEATQAPRCAQIESCTVYHTYPARSLGGHADTREDGGALQVRLLLACKAVASSEPHVPRGYAEGSE